MSDRKLFADVSEPPIDAPDTVERDGAPADGSVADTSVSQEAEASSNPLCGNGRLDPREECDDSRVFDFDGCTSECQLTPGLRALFSFEEPSGAGVWNATDSDWGQLQLGWGVGVPLANDDLAQLPNGVIGAGIQLWQNGQFDLSEQRWRETFVNVSSLMPPPPNGTIALWFRAERFDDNDARWLFWFGDRGDGAGGTDTTDFSLGIATTGRARLKSQTATGVQPCEVSALEPIAWNQWHHMVATYSNLDGGDAPGSMECALYVDGALIETDRGSPAVPHRMRRAHLGRAANQTNARTFTGAIDEFLMLDFALSPGQVSELYTSQSNDKRPAIFPPGKSPPDLCAKPASSQPPTVTFDSPDSLEAFTFSRGTDPLAPARWTWVSGSEPHLVQAALVRAPGTVAIYEETSITNGAVEFRGWSDSIGAMGAVLRYLDADHYYAFSAGVDSYRITKVDGGTVETLACAGPLYECGVVPGTYAPQLSCPGVTIRFEAMGDTLRGFVGGALVAEVLDTSYTSGKVGLITESLDDGHFDDFAVEVF